MRQDEIRADVLVLFMKGLMYHSLACVIYNFASEKTLQMNLWLLVLYVPLFLFAFIRRKCSKFTVFIICHALTAGILLLIIQGWEERILIGGCTAFMAAASLYKRLRDEDIEEACPSVFSLALFLLLYLSTGQNNRVHVAQICYYEAFLFLILFMIYRNLTSTTAFLKSNVRMENLPVKQIRGMNRILLSVFIVCLSVGMLLMPYLPVRFLFHGAGWLIRMLIRGIVMFLMWIFKSEDPQMESFGESAEETMLPLEAGETSMLAQIFEKFFMTAVYVILAAGAVYLLVRGLYELYQRFYEQNKDIADESEFIWENPAIKMRIGRKRQIKDFFTGRSVNERIRHLYKKSIQKQLGAKMDISTAMTVTEVEHRIKKETAEKIVRREMEDGDIWKDEKMKQRILLYQKARYSQYECGKQELEMMKQNLK